ncbi:MAG: glycerophosphodiester phosphodiesterase [Calditrichaceae bacterium]|nr:glycerophosphodiester phosphodiesterase [Calditrichaceae bacterium]RQV96699.1 MAG: glycerophosphodiester phosphodiesterase [Calditrichota bacterium]
MELQKFKLIAHRGEHELAPENTITAFQLAVKQGATALETDVRLCADGEVVLFHDYTLSRHFKDRRKIAVCTLKELKSLSFSGQKYKYTDQIATLNELLESFKGTIPINIDIKTYLIPNKELCLKVIRAVERHNMINQVWVSSFNPVDLHFLKKAQPALRTGYLYNSLGMIHFFIDIFLKSDAWHPHYSQVSPGFFSLAERMGKEVYIWTVNKPAVLKKISKHKFNGIITDKFFRTRPLAEQK